MQTNLPKNNQVIYNESKLGFYGELGEGANAKIRFLQTVITKDDLDSITLISNIPGSESWEVKDLFQRDVDDERVTKDILPYFKNKDLVKYFSPITLILLPMADNGRDVIKDIEFIEKQSDDDKQYREYYEKKNYYKFSIFENTEPFGKIEWNNRNCYLVAIDGQHRLSALKRWKNEPISQFNDWKIPVIILNIFKVSNVIQTANLLEIVRKTFVYINTKSEKINDARKILLNDESVNAICTQELIQYAHENDIKPLDERNQEIIPLLFFDWQGKVSESNKVEAPASIKSIEEIHSWLNEYILGEDGSDFQKIELELTDIIPPLESYFANGLLSHDDAHKIRSQYRKVLLPGLLYFFHNFEPYKNYIKECRTIEKKSIDRSDNAQHAFMKLRFGSHNAPQDQMQSVQVEFDNLREQFNILKNAMPNIIIKDIGMRGIMFAFGECKSYINNKLEYVKSWSDFSILFTDAINEIYNEGWFEHYEKLNSIKKRILTNLIYDESNTIVNYKITQAKDGLGTLLVLLVFKKLLKNKTITEDQYIDIWYEYSSTLRKTYEKGLRKYHRSILQASWNGTINEFNNEVKKLAEDDSNKRIDELQKYIDDKE